MLSNFAFSGIIAVLNKDLKLHDASRENNVIYLKKGSTIFIEDRVFSQRGVTWYKIKDGYVNSKYVNFVRTKNTLSVNETNATNNRSN